MTPPTAMTAAVVWEGEDGEMRTLTWSELRTLTDRIASGSRRVACNAATRSVSSCR